MRTYRYGRACGVIRIRIASLRGTGKHVSDTRDTVRWLGFMSAEVGCPLHRCGIRTHRRVAYNVRVTRHTGKAVAAFAQNYRFALRIFIDDPCGLRNVIWSCGHCPSDFFLRRVTCLRRYSVVRSLGFGTAYQSDPNYQKQRHRSDGARQELTFRTLGFHLRTPLMDAIAITPQTLMSRNPLPS